MANPVDRAQVREETKRLSRASNVSEEEALHAVLRRASKGDYRLAIDDAALSAESNETQALIQSEFDQTQTALITESNETQALIQSEFDQTQTAINSTTSSVNSVLAKQTDGTQVSKINGATGTTIASTGSSLNVNVTNAVTTVSLNTTQYNNIVSLLTRIAVATEATDVNTRKEP